jgi:hypothetical protein
MVTGAMLLLIASLALPALAAVQDSFQEPEDRATATVPLALLMVGWLWPVAAIGDVPVERERRRFRQVSAG